VSYGRSSLTHTAATSVSRSRFVPYAEISSLYLTLSQLVDDVLDYEAGEATLGKPGNADLKLGLATGPALAAWEEHPEMGPLIARKFDQPGDVELVRPFFSSRILADTAL
jgi:geranylgeranyl pyrophosphate synthase